MRHRQPLLSRRQRRGVVQQHGRRAPSAARRAHAQDLLEERQRVGRIFVATHRRLVPEQTARRRPAVAVPQARKTANAVPHLQRCHAAAASLGLSPPSAAATWPRRASTRPRSPPRTARATARTPRRAATSAMSTVGSAPTGAPRASRRPPCTRGPRGDARGSEIMKKRRGGSSPAGGGGGARIPPGRRGRPAPLLQSRRPPRKKKKKTPVHRQQPRATPARPLAETTSLINGRPASRRRSARARRRRAAARRLHRVRRRACPPWRAPGGRRATTRRSTRQLNLRARPRNARRTVARVPWFHAARLAVVPRAWSSAPCVASMRPHQTRATGSGVPAGSAPRTAHHLALLFRGPQHVRRPGCCCAARSATPCRRGGTASGRRGAKGAGMGGLARASLERSITAARALLPGACWRNCFFRQPAWTSSAGSRVQSQHAARPGRRG